MAELRKVTNEDYRFLCELLLEKEPYQAISHKVMPTWKEHVAFMDNKPYKRDYIILMGKELVGRIYLTRQNEIGLHIKREWRGKSLGGLALEELMKRVKTRPLLANIAPANQHSQRFFEKHGFKLIQFTYKYEDR